LLENAETHGGGAVAVRVERRDDTIAVEVDDAGPGVAAADRARMFSPFERGGGRNGNGHAEHTPPEPTPIDARTGGLGLGLALVARIAAAHGGRAWIDDRPGGGARAGFSVSVAALEANEPVAVGANSRVI
jgi:two-component system, OmpR family, sensor histidine kinase MtrB